MHLSSIFKCEVSPSLLILCFASMFPPSTYASVTLCLPSHPPCSSTNPPPDLCAQAKGKTEASQKPRTLVSDWPPDSRSPTKAYSNQSVPGTKLDSKALVSDWPPDAHGPNEAPLTRKRGPSTSPTLVADWPPDPPSRRNRKYVVKERARTTSLSYPVVFE